MDVDARGSEDHCEPVMIQPQALSTDVEPVPDPWSTWAQVVDLATPADEPPAEPVAEPEPGPELATVVARLADELADERRLRTVAEDRWRDADARAHAAEAEAARHLAEVTAGQKRIAELERDRDEVIRRAEELLTAVRERGDQRLASELETARRQWSDLLAEERRRGDALDGERAALLKRVQDAWLAAAVLRRSRPLRPRSSMPATAEAAQQEVLEALDESETDPAFAAESPQLAGEIEELRQRLRGQVYKPAEIDEVEEGVEDLRVLRLAREQASNRRRK